MITAIEQHEHDLEELVQIARAGEEVVLTRDGQAVAKITALPPSIPGLVTQLRTGEGLQPGIPGMNIAAKNRKPSPEALKKWMAEAAAAAAAAATGKPGMTTEEIIDDIRSERC